MEEGFGRRVGRRVRDQRWSRTVFPQTVFSTHHLFPDLSSLLPAPLSHKITRSTSQVTHMYSHGNARNDHTVLHYGFLDRSRWEQPRVCCSDLEGGNLWNCNAVDRDFRDLGAGKDIRDIAAMRRSKTKRERHAPNCQKQATKKIAAFCSFRSNLLRDHSHADFRTLYNRSRGARCVERAARDETRRLPHFGPRRRVFSFG